MTATLTDALRRRGAIVLVIALLVAAALAVAGCGGSDDESGASQPSDVAAYVPASAPVYFDLSTDIDGPQWQQLLALAKKFPAFPQLRAKLEEALNAEGVDFDAQVKPLLGERAALAALSLAPEGAGESDEHFLGVIAIASGKEDQVKAFATRQGLRPDGRIGDADAFSDPNDPSVVFAVTEDALLFADRREDIQAALDARDEGGDANLAGSSRFKDAISKLPADVFGQLYVDLGRIASTMGGDARQLEQAGIADATIAASLAAEPEGLRVKGLLLGAPDLGSTPFTPSLARHVPADAVAYLGIENVSRQIGSIIQQVRDGSDEETRRQIDQLRTQLPALLGVTSEQLTALGANEQGLAVMRLGGRPHAALLLEVADGAQAQATLDKLRENVPALIRAIAGEGTQVPPFRQVSLTGGASGWEMPLRDDYGVVYTVRGNLAVIGSSVAAVNRVLEPGTPLSGAGVYRQATAAMPDQVTAVLVANLGQVVTVLRDVGVLREVPAELRANLAPLESLAAWAVGGQTPTFEIFLRIA